MSKYSIGMIPINIPIKILLITVITIFLSGFLSGCSSLSNNSSHSKSNCNFHSETETINTLKNINAYYMSENWEKAEDLINSLDNYKRNSPDILFKLANIYSTTLRPEKAIMTYWQILSINPEHYKARHNLGVLYIKQGIYEISESRKHLPVSDKEFQNINDLIKQLTNY